MQQSRLILIWQVAFVQALNRPFLGYGLESFRIAYSNYFKNDEMMYIVEYRNRKNLIVDRTHNYILDLLIFPGIAGILAWGMLVYLLLARARNQVIIISLVAYLIWIQFQIQSVVHLMYFWLLVGLIDREHLI